MANALYTSAKQKLLEGSIAWLTDNIKAVLVDTASYTVNLTGHDFLDDIAAGARTSTSANFASKTSTGGVADAADFMFPLVNGNRSEAIVLYKDTGTDATSPLIAYIDTATGLPVDPNGGNIEVTIDVTGLFSL